jgi:hypothetical protein
LKVEKVEKVKFVYLLCDGLPLGLDRLLYFKQSMQGSRGLKESLES